MSGQQRVMLTGAGGQLGIELLDKLVQSDREYSVLNRRDLDITDATAINHCVDRLQPDVIINAAAYTRVDEAETDSDLAHAVNAEGARHLALAANRIDATLIHLSTDYVFNGGGEKPFRETDQTDPLGVYGKTKLDGDAAIIATAHKYYILRVSWVFGAFGPNFVATMIRLASQRDSLSIVSDQVGGPTYTGHISETILSLLSRIENGHPPAYGLYHYCGQPFVSWFEFASSIMDSALALSLIERKPALTAIPASEYPLPAQRPANSRLDCSLIQETMGIAQPDWRSGLTEMLTRLKKSQESEADELLAN